MGTIRVYIDAPLTCRRELQLPEAQSHHLGRVLRLRPGAVIYLFNGTGGSFRTEISAVHKQLVTVLPDEFIPDRTFSTLPINLAQGISRGRHMDYTIQKAVELGVARIIPLVTEHGNVHLEAERQDHKLSHWRKIIIGACEQCGRNLLPELWEPVAYADWIATPSAALRLLLDPGTDRTLGSITPVPGEVTILSGPEGGFSESEIAIANAQGCLAVRLGPRILRTETAAIAAISACQTLWGDMA